MENLRRAVGRHRVLTEASATRPYATGFRSGGGPVAAVVRPEGLVAFWRALTVCADANAIVIIQAANTGLTGGSTPDGDDYDRDVVVISPMAADAIHLIEGGRQVVCLPGATLYALEARLKPLGREPHSVIGSSCIGASVMGGVCNNSGGALVQRGPAYTELALYARLGEDRRLELVNHLGIRIEGDPEAILELVERGDFAAADIAHDAGLASAADYARRVRAVDADTPARFNACPDQLHEAAGCAGRVAVFAVRLDTFPAQAGAGVFCVGANDPAELTDLRRHMLTALRHLPISAEYMHRDCFDIAAKYGKDTVLAIRWLGTARLPALYRWKNRIDAWAERLGRPAGFSERLLQRLSALAPSHLPPRMLDYRDRFEHHLILKIPAEGLEEAEACFAARFPSASGDVFRCSDAEAEQAFLHRFAAAGAAIRYKAVHAGAVEDIVALDVALRRNDPQWVEDLPPELSGAVVQALHYGHFFCHVFHRDYIVGTGTDPDRVKQRLLSLLDARGAEYPAEHNVGHLYPAKPGLVDFYRALDPCNAFNPGIGGTPRHVDWTDP